MFQFFWYYNKINNRNKNIHAHRIDIPGPFTGKIVECNLSWLYEQGLKGLKELIVEMKVMSNTMADELPEVLLDFQIGLPAIAAIMFFYMLPAIEAIVFFSVLT